MSDQKVERASEWVSGGRGILSAKAPASRQAERFGFDKATVDSDSGDVPFCSPIDVRRKQANKNKEYEIRVTLSRHSVSRVVEDAAKHGLCELCTVACYGREKGQETEEVLFPYSTRRGGLRRMAPAGM